MNRSALAEIMSPNSYICVVHGTDYIYTHCRICTTTTYIYEPTQYIYVFNKMEQKCVYAPAILPKIMYICGVYTYIYECKYILFVHIQSINVFRKEIDYE